MGLTLGAIRQYCLKKPGKVVEDFPFDEQTLTVKVFGKVFLIADIISRPLSLNLKCEPNLAVDLRARYEAITPGYHMSKKHWNSVRVDGTIPDAEILSMIDHSFEQVVAGLKQADRKKIEKKGQQKE